MTAYNVWIVLEKDDEDEEKRWWSIDHFPTEEEARERIAEMCQRELDATGSRPEELEE